MVSDPSGLIDRIPELAPLCEDARVRAAVASGDPFKVYRALFWARLTGRLRSQQDVLKQLLKNRRLFAKEAGTPWLGTFNSLGASFTLESDTDPQDGTSIALHAIVVLFKVPLLPLGAYVVRQGESSGLGSSWQIFARVPLSPFAWLYSRGVALAALLLVLGGIGMGVKASRYHDVWVVNGFDVPLTVSMGEQSLTVAAGRHARFSDVPVGRQPVRTVSEEGVEVETLEVDVRSGVDLIAYNIAGGGVAVLETVIYAPDNRPPPAAPEPKVYCGERIITLRDVDYVFTSPPQRISMDKHDDEERRTRFFIPDGIASHLDVCVSILSDTSRLAALGPATRANALLHGWDNERTSYAIYVAAMTSAEEALELARIARDVHPADTDVHRVYQEMSTRAGRAVEVRAEYQKRLAEQPDSAQAHYLVIRLLDGVEALPAAEAALRRFPADPPLLRSVAYQRALRADWKGVHEAWERLRQASFDDAVNLAEYEIAALAGLGQLDVARARIGELFRSAANPAHRRALAELHARIAQLRRDPAPDALIGELEKEAQKDAPDFRLWWVRAQCGLDGADLPKDEPVVRFVRALKKAPSEALAVARTLDQREVNLLDEATWALGMAEALLSGDEAAQKTLDSRMLLTPDESQRLRRYVRGEVTDLGVDYRPSVAAAAYAVRGREAKRRDLVEKAHRAQPLPTVIDEAVASWNL